MIESEDDESNPKALRYLQKIGHSYEVVVMVSSIKETKGEPSIVKGFMKLDTVAQSTNPVKVQGPQPVLPQVTP